MDAVAAFRAFDATRMSMLSTRTVAFDGGTAYFDDGYPERYISNVLIVEAADVPARRLLKAADELLGSAGLAHRRIRIRDDAAAVRLAPSLRTAGYTDERVGVMVLRRPPDRPAVHSVEELRFDDVRGLTEEIYRREPPMAPATVTRLHRATCATGRDRWNEAVRRPARRRAGGPMRALRDRA
jgi:hypothetical protein